MPQSTSPAYAGHQELAAGYPANWNFALEDETLVHLLDKAVAEHAGRPCLDFYGRKLTYRQFGDLVNQAAKGFQNMGVRKGDRVGKPDYRKLEEREKERRKAAKGTPPQPS